MDVCGLEGYCWSCGRVICTFSMLIGTHQLSPALKHTSSSSSEADFLPEILPDFACRISQCFSLDNTIWSIDIDKKELKSAKIVMPGFNTDLQGIKKQDNAKSFSFSIKMFEINNKEVQVLIYLGASWLSLWFIGPPTHPTTYVDK